MSAVNALDMLDIEKTDCSYVLLDLSRIERWMGEVLIFYFPGSKIVSDYLRFLFLFGRG